MESDIFESKTRPAMLPNNYYLPIIFITAIIIEGILQSREGTNEHKLKGTYTNILIGLIFSAIGLTFNGSLLFVLSCIHEFSFFKISKAWYHWISIFVILDLVHYLIHCLEHNLRIFWAIHSIHHSSETFNFSTAIRGPLGTAVYKLFYATPLCLLGFDPLHVIMVDQVIMVYAFFLHTEHVKKLGILEYFLNTPSHHRVHHSNNEEYLDKNYGACLIIWDKLFGTFKEENAKPIYGLTTPLKSYNPIRLITHEWVLITKDLRSTNRISNWLSFLFNKPGWKPQTKDASNSAIRSIKYGNVATPSEKAEKNRKAGWGSVSDENFSILSGRSIYCMNEKC